jgi:hypothetical protein
MWLLRFAQSTAGQVHVKREHRVVSKFTLDRGVVMRKLSEFTRGSYRYETNHLLFIMYQHMHK